MIQYDFEGIWKENPEYRRTLFSGVRPIFQVKEDYMSTGILEFKNQLTNGELVWAKLICPRYCANSVWQGKNIDVFDGSKRIGSIVVDQILNPILDIDGEKWILIDGRDIYTIDDFFREMFVKLTDGTDPVLGQNLNAFNDLLWGGFGFHGYGEPLNIVWIFADISKERLGEKYEVILEIIHHHESGKIKLELYPEHVFE